MFDEQFTFIPEMIDLMLMRSMHLCLIIYCSHFILSDWWENLSEFTKKDYITSSTIK